MAADRGVRAMAAQRLVEAASQRVYVDETGNFGEGFIGLGVFSPAVSLSDDSLLAAVRSDPNVKAAHGSQFESIPYLHASENPPIRESVFNWIRRNATGVFEFVWFDDQGEVKAREAGMSRDDLFDLMLALPCIGRNGVTVVAEEREAIQGDSALSLWRRHELDLASAVEASANPLVQLVRQFWRPGNVSIQTRTKNEQSWGLQVVDYLVWLRQRRFHGRSEPVPFDDVARKQPLPDFGTSPVHIERYLVGPTTDHARTSPRS